jgi:hypothetical protein
MAAKSQLGMPSNERNWPTFQWGMKKGSRHIGRVLSSKAKQAKSSVAV